MLVAEKSGLIKLFPNLTTNTYTVVADLRTKVHNFWDRGLLGLAIDPELRDEQLHLRPLLLRRDDRRHRRRWGPASATSDGCPTPPGADDRRLRHQRPPVAPDGRRRGLDGQRAGADRRLVPAVPEPLDRLARVRRRRLSLRQRRRRRELQQPGLGPVRRRRGQSAPAEEPLRRSSRSRRRRRRPSPTAEGGALRSQSPRRTAGEPRLLNGTVLRVDPATGAARARQPAHRQRGRQRAAHHRLRLPQPVPHDRQARHQRGLGRRRRLEHVGGDRPDSRPDHGAQLRLAVLRGQRRRSTRASNICPTQAADDRARSSPTTTARRSSRATAARPAAPSVAGMAFYQGGSNYPANYDERALLLGLLAQVHVGDVPGRQRRPRSDRRAAFASSRAGARRPARSGRTANVYYADFDGGRICARQVRPRRRRRRDQPDDRRPRR